MSPHMTILMYIVYMIIEKFQSLPLKIHRLGYNRKFGRKFGSALFFVSNFGTYCLSERSAEVRPNRKFGLSLLGIAWKIKKVFIFQIPTQICCNVFFLFRIHLQLNGFKPVLFVLLWDSILNQFLHPEQWIIRDLTCWFVYQWTFFQIFTVQIQKYILCQMLQSRLVNDFLHYF